ncbi:MAG: DUF6516 family protein [Gallionellaceae bacterium]|nr:DUF6516 family protein [Gallionellaceae bacterium]
MKAILVHKTREQFSSGVIEIIIWRVPEPVLSSGHLFKYRLAYLVKGQRVIGYDNERGKGGHKHIGSKELPYRFVSPQQLFADFWHDVKGYTN